jgi:beta-lactamase regulating signal transducer with metallopeptidase domain
LLGALAGVWLAGSIAWFILVAYRIACFRRWLRCARQASQELREQAEWLAERLGLATCPSVWLLPGRLSPMVWALGRRPRLLVPSGLWERLDLGQQAALLVHELAHLRRRDHWVRGLEFLVTGLYWWHPVVWWACREIREAEEQCCDAWVVSTLPRAARAYAIALMETVDFLSETQNALPAVASGIGQIHDLRRRLTMIMHGKTPRALSGAGLWMVLGIGTLLPLMPTWAQEPEEQAVIPAAEEQQPVVVGEPAVRVEGVRVSEQDRPALESNSTPASEPTQSADEIPATEAREQARKEVENLKREVDRMKRQFDLTVKRLEAAQRRLSSLNEMNPSGRVMEATPGQDRPMLAPRREGSSGTERRLSELERKLAALLDEVQSLRREMRRSGPGMMPGQPSVPSTPPGEKRPPRGAGGPPLLPGMPGAPGPLALPPTPARAPAALVAPAAPAPAALPATPRFVPAPTPSPDPAPEPPDTPSSNEQPEVSATPPR